MLYDMPSITVFCRHLKLEIALAIPASSGDKIDTPIGLNATRAVR